MRTLRRPMFRTGGSAGTGITSGLAPRQGYDNGKRVEKLGDLRNLPLSDLRKLSQSMAYQPRGTNVYDFLTEFGLGLASTPPTGNIVQTAAQVARAPYDKFLKGKREAAQMGYASQADMFKTLIEAQSKILTGAAESGAGVKEGYSEKIGQGIDAIWKLKDDLEAGTITQEEHDKAKNKIIQKLGPFLRDNPEIERLFDVEDYASETYDEHKDKFLTEKLMDDPTNPGMQVTQREYYMRLENQAELRRLATDSYMQEFQNRRLGLPVSKAQGGRIGYQNAGPVYGSPTIMSKAATDTEVEDAYGVTLEQERAITDQQVEDAFGVSVDDAGIPAEMKNITERELRRRLPPEVGDDVVKLLANSAEALEDFAMIKTAQDIARFNRKYGVDLTLPAEA